LFPLLDRYNRFFDFHFLASGWGGLPEEIVPQDLFLREPFLVAPITVKHGTVEETIPGRLVTPPQDRMMPPSWRRFSHPQAYQ
jgi:hypothetical protein